MILDILNWLCLFAAMPESSAWPDIRRWGELHNNEDDFDEAIEEEGNLEAAVVVHNELYVSEGEDNGDEEDDDEEEADYNLQVAVQEELVEEGDSDRQSHISGISQQDRDNKTILLRQAASGKLSKSLENRDY